MTHTRSHMNVGLDLEIITTFYVNNAVGRFSKLSNVNISKCIKMDIEPYISQPTTLLSTYVLPDTVNEAERWNGNQRLT